MLKLQFNYFSGEKLRNRALQSSLEMDKLKKQLVHYKSELFSLRNKELSESKQSL